MLYPILVFLCFLVSATAQDSCVSCSYNFAGTGNIDRECVTDPFSYVQTRNIFCNLSTHTCQVRAVYISGYARLQSLDRSCQLKDSNVANGCDGASVPTCVFRCNSDLCNQIDGDLHEYFKSSNVATRHSAPCVLTSLVVALCLLPVRRVLLRLLTGGRPLTDPS